MSSVAAAMLVAAAILLLPPGVAAATTYGISEPQGFFASCPTHDDPCSSLSGVDGLWRDTAFTSMRSQGRSMQAVRLPVTYDAVATWNPAGGCTLSNPYRFAYTDQGGRPHPAQEAWNDLLYGIREAYADHLQPLIVIDGYTAGSAIHAYSGSTAPGDAGEPDPTTTAGRWSYYFGVRGILNGIAAHLPQSEWPHRWEAWNEPNGGCTYLNNHCAPSVCAQINQPADNFDTSINGYTCSSTGPEDTSCAAGSADGGAAKAACLWIEARNTIVQYPGHAGDEVAAGSFSFPSTGYLTGYIGLLNNRGYHPGTWAVHDYGDPTASGWLGWPVATQLQAFETALGSQTQGISNQLWVTESGVLLTDRDRTYTGFDSIPCVSASPAVPSNTLGACINGNETAQITSAEAFFNLTTVTGGPPVTALYWYQFRGVAGAWDSGLLDSNGTPRAAYCVWTGQAPADCLGSPAATPAVP
ncbi:MAG: hypothetical protein ACXVVQ_04150 [Solirubrobacteraceae bacterium]